ncbi:MAG: Rpn family recombination-promoting nuclease/putative transposase [Synergistaceae bacterium]|nr:Rpn family recombination-promoting nuclease/putative transposase [Synergistaceae bacterium]
MTLLEHDEEFQRKWESLGISNDFIFGKVMQDEELCAELLRRILPDLDIERVEFPEKQKTISEGIDSRGVRLDIFTRSFSRRKPEALHDVEMEMVNRGNLPKRSRGYHILIGMNAMNREQVKGYNDLPETYVIFICNFDPFGEGRHIYSFTRRCAENAELELKDGTHTIFLNACGTADDVSPGLKAFLDFVKGIPSDDPFIRKLEDRVREAKQSSELRRDYMMMSMWEQGKFEEGRAEGIAIGEARGVASTLDAAAAFMRENGLSAELISKFERSFSEDRQK